jgi:hypothetical protein
MTIVALYVDIRVILRTMNTGLQITIAILSFVGFVGILTIVCTYCQTLMTMCAASIMCFRKTCCCCCCKRCQVNEEKEQNDARASHRLELVIMSHEQTRDGAHIPLISGIDRTAV